MKKLFTILCAAVIALSANAEVIRPMQVKKSEAKTFAQKEEVSLSQLKAGMKDVKLTAPAHKAVAGADFTVNAAQGQAIYLKTYYDLMAAYGYIQGWDGSDLWQMSFYDSADNNVGGISIITNNGVQIAGTYTLSTDPSSMEYGYFVRAAGDTVDVDGDITIAYEAMAANGFPTYHVQGQLTGIDGSNVAVNFSVPVLAIDYYEYQYVSGSLLWLEDAPFVLGDTIHVVNAQPICRATYYEDFNYNQVIISDGTKYLGSIMFEGDEFAAGTYTLQNEDLIADYTYVVVDSFQYNVLKLQPSKIVVTKNADHTIFNAYLTCIDGNVYHFSGEYYMPVITNWNNLTITDGEADLTYYEEYGDVTFAGYVYNIAGQPIALVALDIYMAEDAVDFNGTYTMADLWSSYSYVVDANGEYYILDANIVITNNNHLEADLICTNGEGYKVVMTFGEEEPQAIENSAIAAKAAKMIVNNELVIVKNGARYNVLGARL